MENNLRALLGRVPGMRDSILSDAVIYNQLSFGKRTVPAEVEFITSKLDQRDVGSYRVTEQNNIIVSGSLSDTIDDKSLLVFVQMGNGRFSTADRFIETDGERAYGSGVAESALAVSALLNVADMLAGSGLMTEHRLAFLFAAPPDSSERFTALEHFINNNGDRIHFALELNGIGLGSIGYRSVGEYTFDIISRTTLMDITDNPAQIDVVSAMDVLTELASRLKSIGWPSRSGVFINIANIRSNAKLRKIPNEAIMRLELISSDNEHMEFAKELLTHTVSKLSRELRTHIGVREIAHVPSNIMMENNPMLSQILSIHKALHLKSKLTLINDEAAYLLSRDIPALSLGITTGEVSVDKEYIDIAPVNTGVRQLFYVLDRLLGHGCGREV